MKSHEDRAYQDEIFAAVYEYLENKEGNPVVASPGGTGKSHVMNRIIKHAVVEWPGTRVISLVHDAKVVRQNARSMIRFWDEAPVGVYSSSLKCRDTVHCIIYAGIQSVAKRASELRPDLIIVVECDMVSPKEETLYQKFFKAARELNPRVRIVGFTATPYRLGTGCLTNTDLWDEICIDLTTTERFNWFIENGFLSPLVTKKSCVEIDITNIAMRGGEFDEKGMQEAADTDELNKAVVEECIRYGHDRKHWLVFASGVKHGHKLAKLFNARGVPTVMLSGEDSVDFRDKEEAKFRAGEYRCAVHVGLYGRGWDFPALDMIAWARATQSVQLWIQGCVRLTRIFKGKLNGLVLDFAGNTRRLGPINDPVIPQMRRKGDGEKGEAPVKECPECHSYLHTRVMVCPDCGYVFPPPSAIKKTAGTDDIMKTGKSKKERPDPTIDEFNVLGIRYQEKQSNKGTKYLQVTYSVGLYSFRENLFFESQAQYPKHLLKIWWKHRGGEMPVPTKVDEALERAQSELRIPSLIRVDTAQKYPEVLGCEFGDVDPPNEDIFDEDEPPF